MSIAHAWSGGFPVGIENSIEKVGVMPDGSLLLVDELHNYTEVIHRLAADGSRRRVAGSPKRFESSGDGGPATKAGLDIAGSPLGRPDGSFLIAEYGADRIRQVDPAGIISTIARVPEPGSLANLADGGFAVANGDALYKVDITGHMELLARFRPRDDFGGVVAAASDGTLYVLVGGDRILRRQADGTFVLHARASVGGGRNSWVFDIACAPDGTVFAAARNPSRIVRISPEGAATVVVPPKSFAVLGRRAGDVYPFSPTVLPDGSLVVSTSYGPFIFPSDRPAFPAVATRAVKRGRMMKATIESTHPGKLTLRVLRHGRSVLTKTAVVAAGESTHRIPRLHRGTYRIELTVSGPSLLARSSSRLEVRRRGIDVRAY